MMKTIPFFLMFFIYLQVFPQQDQASFVSYYKLTKDINEEDTGKYINVMEYLKTDSIFQDQSIYYSPYLTDLDLFFFKDDILKEDSTLISSVYYKSKWFEDYHSLILDQLFGKQNKNTNFIAFFSLVTHNMLRIEVLPYRKDLYSSKFEVISRFSSENITSYLFIFKEDSNQIKRVVKHPMIYN